MQNDLECQLQHVKQAPGRWHDQKLESYSARVQESEKQRVRPVHQIGRAECFVAAKSANIPNGTSWTRLYALASKNKQLLQPTPCHAMRFRATPTGIWTRPAIRSLSKPKSGDAERMNSGTVLRHQKMFAVKRKLAKWSALVADRSQACG